MSITLPLDKMTVREKLDLMEMFWMDLAKSPEEIPGYEWHMDVLDERQQRIDAGNETTMSWEEAKARLQAEVNLMRENAMNRKPEHGA